MKHYKRPQKKEKPQSQRMSTAMLSFAQTRRPKDELMSLKNAEVDKVRNIAYKEVNIGEASDLYATNETLYIGLGSTLDSFVPPLRFSKDIVNNLWNINLTFFKLVDFLLESHFHWKGTCRFFVEIPIP